MPLKQYWVPSTLVHTLELVRPWLDPHFKQLAAEIRTDPARLNYKAVCFKEWTQAHFKVLPEYRVQETSHAQERFIAEVWLRGQQLGQEGTLNQAAEQAAAQMAFSSAIKALLRGE